jgi:hypothetical protein
MRPPAYFTMQAATAARWALRLQGTLAEVEKAFVTTTSNAYQFSGGLLGVSF